MSTSTLLIEGTFPELAEELAQYIDNVNSEIGVQKDIEAPLAKIRDTEQSETPDTQAISKLKDEVLKKIITKATVLNGAPEREFSAAYNLLINLAAQSPMREQFFERLCQYLSEQPVGKNSSHGSALAISTLTTIFNTLPSASDSRYDVFLAILKLVKSSASAQAWEALVPQMEESMANWLLAWDLDDEDIQNLMTTISDVAEAQGDSQLAYQYLLKALEACPPASASQESSLKIAERTLTTALTNPAVTDFTPLTASDAIQALRKSKPALLDLLDIFSSDDYSTFQEFISSNKLPALGIPEDATSVLETKSRLLTLASISASSPTRSVAYSEISEALRIPAEDVEIWVIDTIRAGLVEGKLSQQRQEFLVQRATYRVFGEKQWSEIQSRLMIWRRSLEQVLGVVRQEKERYAKEGMNGPEEQINGYQARDRRQGGRRNDRDRDRRQEPREIDVRLD